MIVDEVIGRNVHHLLWEQHKQQRELYELLQLSRASLSKKLRGDVAWSAREVAIAAQLLDVEIGALYEDRETAAASVVPDARRRKVAGAGFEPATSGLRTSRLTA